MEILKLQELCDLGSGSFATVKKAIYNNQIVAVKIFTKLNAKNDLKTIEGGKRVEKDQPSEHNTHDCIWQVVQGG
jgi:hypothetical protein